MISEDDREAGELLEYAYYYLGLGDLEQALLIERFPYIGEGEPCDDDGENSQPEHE